MIRLTPEKIVCVGPQTTAITADEHGALPAPRRAACSCQMAEHPDPSGRAAIRIPEISKHVDYEAFEFGGRDSGGKKRGGARVIGRRPS